MSHVTKEGKVTLLRVIKWLENGAHHIDIENGRVIDKFDMAYGVNKTLSCGTVCCIAGAVVQFKGLGEPDENGDIQFYGVVRPEAKELLGIDEETADMLFEPWGHLESDSCDPIFQDPKVAAKVLMHFIKTGEVEWEKFWEEPQDAD